MKNEMPDLYLIKEGKRVGRISPDRGGVVRLIIPPSIGQQLREDLTRVFYETRDTSRDLAGFKSKYEAHGYTVSSEDIAAPEIKEITPLQRREASFIHESNLIENIDEISYEEILQAVVEGKIGGHVSAWRFVKSLGEANIPLDSDKLLRMHKLLTDEQSKYPRHYLEPKYRGKYRDVPVFIGGHAVFDIPDERTMSQFMDRLNDGMEDLRKEDIEGILRFAARIHLEFEKMHPFADGNGRTGRMIVNYILAYFGYPPFVFTNNDKVERYYPAFCVTDSKDSHMMEEYFLYKFERPS